MIELLVIVLLIILLAPGNRGSKYKEITRQQEMRRAMSRLQDKYRHYGA